MQSESIYVLHGVTKREKMQLSSEPDIKFEEEEIPDGAIGEPATFIIMVTMAALSTLAAYLLRKHKGESFEEDVEERLPDGTVKIRKVKWTKSSSEAPEADIIKQIQGVTSLGK